MMHLVKLEVLVFSVIHIHSRNQPAYWAVQCWKIIFKCLRDDVKSFGESRYLKFVVLTGFSHLISKLT